MRYMLLMVDTRELAESRPEPLDSAAPVEWTEEMVGRGVELGGARLRPPEEGRTVRRRGGETLVVDGPYAEVREQVAGFDIIEVTDLDEAIEVASKHPAARFGPIEIRPLWATDDELDLEALRAL